MDVICMVCGRRQVRREYFSIGVGVFPMLQHCRVHACASLVGIRQPFQGLISHRLQQTLKGPVDAGID